MIEEVRKDDEDQSCVNFEQFCSMMRSRMVTRDPNTEMMKAFHIFNEDRTGKITFRNLKAIAKELGENMTDEEIQEMVDEADLDKDGEISF